ncbi:hypothetical protein ACVBIO_15180 [Shewanella sp. 0m-8]
MNKVISQATNKLGKPMNKQQLITAAVLMLLVIAVQVSTDRAGDWMFIGLNLIEIGAGAQSNLTEMSDVSVAGCGVVQQLLTAVFDTLQAFVG